MSEEEIHQGIIIEHGHISEDDIAHHSPVMVPEGLSARDSCGDGTFLFQFFDPKVRWPESAFPVKVFLDKTNNEIGDGMTTAVQNALDEWQSRFGGKQMFQLTTNRAEAKITIGWKQLDGSGKTVAICYYWWNNKNEITKNEIFFDSSENWIVMDHEICGSSGNAFDFQSVCTHELGHGVGFAHNNDPLSCLYPSVRFGETLRRTLSLGDEKGFKELYEIVEIPPPPPPPPLNRPPVAKGLSLEMKQGSEIAIHLEGSDPDGDAITYEITKQPRNGPFALDPATGHVQYRPNPAFFGLETFTYIVTDSHGADSQPADVVIDVKKSDDGGGDVIEITIEIPVDPDPQEIVDAFNAFTKAIDESVN